MGRASRLLSLSALVVVVCVLQAACAAFAFADDWPMFHHDLAHSGTSTSSVPNTNTTSWVFSGGQPVRASAAVVGGVVYYGDAGGMFRALDAATGEVLWTFNAGAPIMSSAAVADGRVHFLATSGIVYALDAGTGALAWMNMQTFSPGGWPWSSPAVHNGRVYLVGTAVPSAMNPMGGGTAVALDAATGDVVWATRVGGDPNSHVAVANGKVYVGTHNFTNAQGATLLALNESDGAIAWQYRYTATHPGYAGMVNHNGPTIADGDADGTDEVYLGVWTWSTGEVISSAPPALPHEFVALDAATGAEEWTFDLAGTTVSTPAFHDGTIFIGDVAGKVTAIDAATRTLVWQFAAFNSVSSAPAVADGKVLFGSEDHIFYALDEVTGAKLWQYDTYHSRIYPSPAVSGGRVFVGNENGKMYAFGPSYAPPVNTPPTLSADLPMVVVSEGDIPANTGLVDDPDGDTPTFGASRGTAAYTLGGTWSWSLGVPADSTDSGLVTVSANDGHATSSCDFTLTVLEVAPTVYGPAPFAVAAGYPYTGTATFTDPGPDTWTADIDYGDGTVVTGVPVSGGLVPLSHTYATGGVFDLTVTVRDDDGASGTSYPTSVSVFEDGSWPGSYHMPAWAEYDWQSVPFAVDIYSFDNPFPGPNAGVDHIEYSIDGGPVQTVAGDLASAVVTGEGLHTIVYRAIDRAGNAGPFNGPYRIRVDLTAPHTVVVGTYPEPGGVRLQIGADDAPVWDYLTGTWGYGSGIPGDGQQYSVDGAPYQSTSGGIHLTEPGMRTVSYFSYDAAGNYETVHTTSVYVPMPAPEITSGPDINGGNVAAVPVAGAAAPGAIVDVTVTGANGGSATGQTTAAGDGSWSLTIDCSPVADGAITYSATASNGAGDTSGPSTASATKDAAAPAAPSFTSAPDITAANAGAVAVSGRAEPGSTVNVTVSDGSGGNVAGSATTDGSGAWSVTIDCSPLADGPVTYAASATDGAGNTSDPASASATKDTHVNAAPAVLLPFVPDLAEGGTCVIDGMVLDPDSSSWTGTIDWGDGTSESCAIDPDGSFHASHICVDDASGRTITVAVVDDEGAAGSAVSNGFDVVNADPTVTCPSGGTVTAGGAYTDTLSATDAGADALAVSVDWGDGSAPSVYSPASGASFGISHVYTAEGDWTISVTVTDDDGGIGTATSAGPVHVLPLGDPSPTITSLTVPADPLPLLNTVVSASAAFTDPQTGDSHTARWDWGDGLVSPGAVNESGGSGTVSGTHVYEAPGVYTVKLTVTDDDGNSASRSASTYLVIYDPNGGFVTGGGWIDSPAGALTADTSAVGRANFGFVSKYKKGATVPEGTTEFQFQAGDLNFHSTSYSWLVVNQKGTGAQFKGNGTINGASAPNGAAYNFMLWCDDGAALRGPDTFRMRIWWETTSGGTVTENVVYDNKSAVITGKVGQPLAGGSIVIHK